MIWKNADYDESYLEYKSKEFGESKLITKLLLNRGITQKDEVDKFLNPESQEMYDPYLFEDMDKAVNRVIEAKTLKEKIVVFGDYDVDGISGTSYL
ncbi:MAG: single-stranded-DNA-specific exonuclease RecJ, partial [Leptotrichiaceae bacterium]